MCITLLARNTVPPHNAGAAQQVHNECKDDTCYCSQECRSTGEQKKTQHRCNPGRSGYGVNQNVFQVVIEDEIPKTVESEECGEVEVQRDEEGEASRTEEPNTPRTQRPGRAAAAQIGTYAETDSGDEQWEEQLPATSPEIDALIAIATDMSSPLRTARFGVSRHLQYPGEQDYQLQLAIHNSIGFESH
jgi:hypothetical protein